MSRTKRNPKLVCLFGSGISIAARMPAVGKLTEQLLPPSEFWRYSGGSYHWGPSLVPDVDARSGWEEQKEAIQVLVSELRQSWLDAGLQERAPWHSFNYEDLVFMLDRLRRTEAEPLLDPAAQNFLRDIRERPKIKELLARIDWEWWRLVDETLSCLIWLVVHKLSRRPNRDEVGYLSFLEEAITELGQGAVSIVTTNHDRVLESSLGAENIRDGFAPTDFGPREWQPTSFDESDRVALCKIHGSVNWYSYHAADGSPMATTILDTGDDRGYDHPEFGQLMLAGEYPGSRPLLLLGTYNKTEQYTQSLFAELHHRAWRTIMEAKNVLVCGYGFGDTGVNSMIWDWAYRNRSRERRLIVVHPSHDELLAGINPGVRRLLQELKQLRIHVPIDKTCIGKRDGKPAAQQLEWQQIAELLLL